MTAELNNLGTTLDFLDDRQMGSARKAAHYQQNQRKSGKSSRPQNDAKN
jgi:hypothetical protein